MNICEETSQNLKNQNVSILEESAVQNNGQRSDTYIEASMLKKGHQSIRKNIIFLGEKFSALGNPYLDFCLKPNVSSNDPSLETIENSTNLYKESYNSCREGGGQAMPSRVIKSQSDVLKDNLLDGVENKTFNACEESAKLIENNLQQSIKMGKSTGEKIVSNKRRYEDGEDNAFILEENVATKKRILFKTEEKLFMENPYVQFILSENSNPHFCVTRNSEELYTNNLASERREEMDEECKRRNKNGVDIFGNHLTSKDRNKMKVMCPHCARKVPAPGFVRHLFYCMKVSMRKSKR